MCVAYLDDLVMWSEVCSLRWRVFIHCPDELAWSGLLAVQVEAVAIGSLLQVAETRPRPASLLLQLLEKNQRLIKCCDQEYFTGSL